jgi:hypothetical protein
VQVAGIGADAGAGKATTAGTNGGAGAGTAQGKTGEYRKIVKGQGAGAICGSFKPKTL